MNISYINSQIVYFFKKIYIFLKKSIPVRFIIIYFILWLAGCLIISQWFCWNDNKTHGFVDSLFLSGSAFSTTGLTIQPTREMKTFGHVILFIMILIGGLGVSSLKVMLWVPFRNLSAVKKIELKDETNLIGKNWKQIIICGFVTVLVLYLLGWIILTLHLIYSKEQDVKTSVWYGLFHSVSATANAGFNIMPGNTLILLNKGWIQWWLIFQIVIGGLGFPIIYEFYEYIVWRTNKKKNIILQKHFKFTIYFKIAIIGTLVLSILSIFIISFVEYYFVTKNKTKINIMNIIFHVFSSRAAGFNFMEMDQFSDGSLIIIIILMWIGTLPYSQCGGVKVTTLLICFVGLWHILKNNNQYHFLKRTITLNNILCSFLIILGSLIMILLFFIIITIQEAGKLSFKEILFEITSAFGTTGLSLIKSTNKVNLTPITKLILILTMFVGQINVITLFALFKKTTSIKRIKYPKENITLF